MNSWLIIIVLISLLFVLVGMSLVLHSDIKRMTKQLEEIIENFGTNEVVRTTTHNKNLARFAAKINQLIHLFKQDQQRNHTREMNLKQEITNISHDLRTPLTSIKGFSELLSNPSLTEAEKGEYLAVVQKKIDNLTHVVDLFYELSQLESLDKKMVMEKNYLDQLVVEVMLTFYGEFEKKQLQVQIDELAVSPILADKKATGRIVANIIQNALAYSKSYVTIDLIEDEEDIRLQVANDVETFDAAEVQRIFDRTFRMDASRTGEQVGLGLHIVQQLVEKQGGHVVADVVGDEFTLEVSFRKWA
ncbi:HAMP domain-containing sensor histidine kinase [Sporosarcina sp. GW1-11]|uniref:sensor histidine kinase n=1 Tax=Sporosarcina sp. GW1-11 TaxID=2899126 RepID=UPI00294D7DEC|nr:HAMP domain-containing sensor histidine kinase [Sporosarcina sp. GW1-11]MDV6377131.1 HAMP domain-containing sensor histidine kinase [Sporosarcina sp. GW1-11]